MNKKLVQTTALAVCLSPFVLGISTVNAVKGLATAPALAMDMRDKARAWQDYAESMGTDPAMARSAMNAIAPLKDSICKTAGLEENEGILTGVPGEGELSAAYASACTSLTTISNTLGDVQLRNDARAEELALAVAPLLSIPEQDGVPIFARQDQFDEALIPVRRLIADGSAENVRETVKAQLDVAFTAVATLDTADTGLGQVQNRGVAGLKGQMRDAGDILRSYLDAPNTEAGEEPDALLTSEEAIAAYWSRLTPQILAALGVDLAILWIAAFLAVSRANLRDAQRQLLHKPHWLAVGDLPPWPDTPMPGPGQSTPGADDLSEATPGTSHPNS